MSDQFNHYHMDRRSFLATLGAVGAGCAGSNGQPAASEADTNTPTRTTVAPTSTPEFRGAADPWRNTEESSTATQQTIGGTVVLPPNTYAVRFPEPKLPARMELSVQVQSDASVDVFVMERAEFERYREQREFLLYTEPSTYDTSLTTINAELQADEHAIVFDHTTTGTAPTDQTVRISYELTLSYTEETATPTPEPTTPRPDTLPFGQFRTVEGVGIAPLELGEMNSSGLPDRKKRVSLSVVASNSTESPVTPPPIEEFVLWRDDERWESEGKSSWPERVYSGERITQEVWFVVSKVIPPSTLNAGYRYDGELLKWEQ